ncbi:MAG: hypothetical protein VYC34_10365 [Planctomycetota bacterium]|nr:hypothetical protein [Planctomycetota bacterium]
MNRTQRPRTPALPLACAAAVTLTAAAAPSHAAVQAAWADAQTWTYRITEMPDFDQRRTSGGGAFGLPNDGAMYCVPTSQMNIICYIANHGFPQVISIGAQPWQSQSVYNAVGINLLSLGSLMSTHPTDGTGGVGWSFGTKVWLGPLFVVSHYYANGNYAPNHDSITAAALQGGLVTFAYGRYDVVGSLGAIPIIDRTGGHVVTLARSARSGSNRVLEVRDPADTSDSLTSQSQFGNREYELVIPRLVATSNSFASVKLMTEIGVNAGPAGSSNRYIDEYMVVKPKYGLALTQNSTVIEEVYPGLFAGFQFQIEPKFPVEAGVFTDAVINPDYTGAWAIVETDGLSQVVNICSISREQKVLNFIEEAESLVFGRNRRLYIMDGRILRCINIDIDVPKEEGEVFPPAPVTRLAFDDANDQVILLSPQENVIMKYDADLVMGDGSVFPIPENVQVGMDAQMAYNPNSGGIMLHTPGQNVVYQLMQDVANGGFMAESISIQGVKNPRGITVDDSGSFYIIGDEGVEEFSRTDVRGSRYQRNPDSPFRGVKADNLFRIACSRQNDPEQPREGVLHIDPALIAEEGAPTPDCLGDITGDGVVNASDLADLLAEWGELGAAGDGDGDGIDADDLANLLGNWGPCGG